MIDWSKPVEFLTTSGAWKEMEIIGVGETLILYRLDGIENTIRISFAKEYCRNKKVKKTGWACVWSSEIVSEEKARSYFNGLYSSSPDAKVVKVEWEE